jgi:hypothetical protein
MTCLLSTAAAANPSHVKRTGERDSSGGIIVFLYCVEGNNWWAHWQKCLRIPQAANGVGCGTLVRAGWLKYCGDLDFVWCWANHAMRHLSKMRLNSDVGMTGNRLTVGKNKTPWAATHLRAALTNYGPPLEAAANSFSRFSSSLTLALCMEGSQDTNANNRSRRSGMHRKPWLESASAST